MLPVTLCGCKALQYQRCYQPNCRDFYCVNCSIFPLGSLLILLVMTQLLRLKFKRTWVMEEPNILTVTGRKHDLETDMPVRDVSQVEAICLISGNETEGEGMVAGDQTCKQNGGPTSVGDQLPSLPMKSSGDSQGTRRKPDLGNGLKEEDRSQANFAAPNNYSPMDCQEDQGYISRESRPSSGTPSPVLEFSGNPTVSVTINTGKCFVNCYHYQEERASGPGSEEDQYHAPEEEQGAEVDEGFPIQEEQRDLDSGKEDGGSAEAAHKDFWRYNPVPHQEEGKESHFPVQDTSGNVY